jgi:hypothetical protein
MKTSDELYILAKEESKRLQAMLKTVESLRGALVRSLRDPNSPKQKEVALRRALIEWQFQAKRRAQMGASATAAAQRLEQLETRRNDVARRVRTRRLAGPAPEAKRAAEADFRRKWLSGCPRRARIRDSPFGLARQVSGAFGRGKRG